MPSNTLHEHLVQKRRSMKYQPRKMMVSIETFIKVFYFILFSFVSGTIENIFVNLTSALVERKKYTPQRRQTTYLPMEDEPPSPKSSCCGF
jgi:hypothetical protein